MRARKAVHGDAIDQQTCGQAGQACARCTGEPQARPACGGDDRQCRRTRARLCENCWSRSCATAHHRRPSLRLGRAGRGLDEKGTEMIAPHRTNRSRRTSHRTDGSSEDTSVAGQSNTRSRASRTSAVCASATRSPSCPSRASCTCMFNHRAQQAYGQTLFGANHFLQFILAL